MNGCRKEEINTSPDRNQEMPDFIPSPFSIKAAWILTQMVLWDTSPPSPRSAGFPNKVAISCPNWSLDLLAACAVSSTG